jgi:hypothetical protein
MSNAKISSIVWCRLNTRNFTTSPDTLGLSHTFYFETYKVSFVLPPVDLVSEDEQEFSRLTIRSRLIVGEELVPHRIAVNSIDVKVEMQETVSLPTEVLQVYPNAYGLLSELKQKEFDAVITKYREVIMGAFNYWLRVMRWKTNTHYIGRPGVDNKITQRSIYLMEKGMEKPYWIESQVYHIPAATHVTMIEWKEAEKILESGYEPLVFYEYLFDARYNLSLGDVYRAVTDLAVAAETYFRALVMRSLHSTIGHGLKKYIDETNIRAVISKFLPDILNESEMKEYKRLDSIIQELFNTRNNMLHSGHSANLSVVNCRKYIDAINALIQIRNIS